MGDIFNDLDQFTVQINEEKAITALHQNRGPNNSTRKTFFLSLNNTVVPNYTKFVSGLKNLKPNNAELKEIHNYYLAGAKLQLEGFIIMRDSLKTTKINYYKFETGNKKVIEGAKQLDKMSALLDKYESKYFK